MRKSEGLSRLVACGCVSPYRTEGRAETREKERREGNRKEAVGRAKRRRKNEESLQRAINPRR